MLITIYIFLYLLLKFIIAENLNRTNFSFRLQNTENEEREGECLFLVISLIPFDDISKEKMNELIICILEMFRDHPSSAKIIIEWVIKPYLPKKLKKILNQNNMSFLSEFVEEVFGPESDLYTDLIDVIKNHKELIDYSLILVKAVMKGKNITQEDFLIYMRNITNIPGMDKVFGHIVNSTHNDALLILVERLLNGTKYAKLYESLKEDFIYPLKDHIIRLIYNILKFGLLIPEDEIKDKEKMVCLLEMIKGLINNIKPQIRKHLKIYLNQTNMSFLDNLTEEIFSDNSTFINDLFDVLENNTELINYTLVLLTSFNKGKNITEDELNEYFINVKNILNVQGIDKVFNHILNSTHNGALLILVEKLLNGTKYFELFECFKEDIIYPYKAQVIRLLYKILKYDGNKKMIIVVIKNFFQDKNNSDFIRALKEKLKETDIQKAVEKISFNSKVGDIIKEELLANNKVIDGFFSLLNDKEIVEIIAGIFVNRKNEKYILEQVPNMIRRIHNINKVYITFLLDVTVKVLKRIVSENSINKILTQNLTKHFNTLFFENETKKYNINEECASSMKKIYFDTYEQLNISNNEKAKKSLTTLRYFFMKKTLLDSTKDKNDFLTYENCLEKDFDNEILKNLDFNFTLKPIYVLAMFDDNKAKRKLSDLIIIEQYNYWLGYCLPLVIKNDKDKTKICSQTDYSNILRIFLEIAFNMTNAEVRSFNIDKKEFEKTDKIYCALNFFIILIPILIQIFLYLYYSISYYKYKKRRIFNQLTINQEEEMKKNKYLSPKQKSNININNYKIITPKWYKYLKEYFDLIKNGSELFNNNSKESNINNINGITYIKGLLGLSMLLYIFGHIFFMLFNLPFKNFTLTDFNSSVTNPFFFIPLIGLRYSPRIILSCSGYTLIYKYLNYIDQQPKLYMLKFIFRQSYKYLLLLLVILYMRYSIYYLTLIMNNLKRPMIEILKFNLELNNQDYFVNFFDFLLAYTGHYSFNNKQNIIQYFYVPLNEIFLFLFGVILISLGYRFKFRNDIIIIVIISLIFVSKIVIYFIFVRDNGKYSTLYYYLYDYGALMLHPVFNLPSFLIGMFFGLINYSIQKGINLYGRDSYQRITSMNNRDSLIDSKELESNDRQTSLKRQITLRNSKQPLKTELDNLEELKYTNEQKDDIRSYSLNIIKNKETENKIKSYNKNIEKNSTFKFSFEEKGRISSINEDYNEKIKEMPFLILPIRFLNFHRQNEGRFYFKVIIILFVLLTTLFSCAHYFVVGKYALVDEKNDDKITTFEKLSFRQVIINPVLNFIYSIDVDLVVFMINWIFFIIYSKGKIADIYDFFNNNFWSFFLKCYYSFIIISTPVILFIIYQNEIVINFSFSNLILFSFISLFIILITVIICYSMYEIPLKKIFKSFFVKEEIFIEHINDELDEDFDLSKISSNH